MVDVPIWTSETNASVFASKVHLEFGVTKNGGGNPGQCGFRLRTTMCARMLRKSRHVSRGVNRIEQ